MLSFLSSFVVFSSMCVASRNQKKLVNNNMRGLQSTRVFNTSRNNWRKCGFKLCAPSGEKWEKCLFKNTQIIKQANSHPRHIKQQTRDRRFVSHQPQRLVDSPLPVLNMLFVHSNISEEHLGVSTVAHRVQTFNKQNQHIHLAGGVKFTSPVLAANVFF